MVLLILDSSVIIAFMTEMDDGDYLKALSSMGFEVTVTKRVIEEVKKEPGKSRLAKAVEEKWIGVQVIPDEEFTFFKKRYPMLDYAEVEVIQKGAELKQMGVEYCCIIDEGAGRKIADRLGLQKMGTEGLLNKMNHLSIIDASLKEKLFKKLYQSSFRSSNSSVQR
jgi:predicted nucleic acid-binding protein